MIYSTSPDWRNIKNCIFFLESNLKMKHWKKGVQANVLQFLKHYKTLSQSVFLILVLILVLSLSLSPLQIISGDQM